MREVPSIMLLLFILCYQLQIHHDSSLHPCFVICGSLRKRSLGGQVNSDVWPDTTSEEFQEGITSQWLIWHLFQLCESSDWEHQMASILLLESWAMCFWSQGPQLHMYSKLKSVRLCVSCACIEGGMPLAVQCPLGLTSSRWNKSSYWFSEGGWDIHWQDTLEHAHSCCIHKS